MHCRQLRKRGLGPAIVAAPGQHDAAADIVEDLQHDAVAGFDEPLERTRRRRREHDVEIPARRP